MSELTISYGEILARLLLTAALCGVQEALEEVSALPGVERVSVMGLREVE